MSDLKNYIRERDAAIIDFVNNDSLEKWHKLTKRYHMNEPKDERVLKGALCKAAQGCTKIPEEVKFKAALKAIELGFNPYIGG